MNRSTPTTGETAPRARAGRRQRRPGLRRLFLSLVVALSVICGLLLPCGAQGTNEPRLALVLGNSNYTGDYEQLPAARADAEGVANILERYGFDVTLRRDQTLSEMRQALKDFEETLSETKGGVALVYFSGHGAEVTRPSTAEEGASQTMQVLIPKDGEAGKRSTLLPLSEVIAVLGKRQSGTETPVNILVIDACRDQAKSARLAFSADVENPVDTLVAYAASERQQAFTSKRMSRYTDCLVSTLSSAENASEPVQAVFSKAHTCVNERYGRLQVPVFTDKLGREFRFALAADPDSRIERLTKAIRRDGDGAPPSAFLERGRAHLENVERGRAECGKAVSDLGMAEHKSLSLAVPNTTLAREARAASGRLPGLCPGLARIALSCQDGIRSVLLEGEDGFRSRVLCNAGDVVVTPQAYSTWEDSDDIFIPKKPVKFSGGGSRPVFREPIEGGERVIVRVEEGLHMRLPLIVSVGPVLGHRHADEREWQFPAYGVSLKVGFRPKLSARSRLRLFGYSQWLFKAFPEDECPPRVSCVPQPVPYAFHAVSVGAGIGLERHLDIAGNFKALLDVWLVGSRVDMFGTKTSQQSLWVPEIGAMLALGQVVGVMHFFQVTRTLGDFKDRHDPGSTFIGGGFVVGLP